jgi:hypothetical protein
LTIRQPIQRLEEVLQVWEEVRLHTRLRLYGIRFEKGEKNLKKPPVLIDDDFRNFLLTVRQDTEFDSRFLPDPSEALDPTMAGYYATDAQCLFSWTGHSRRVYKIPREMQQLLVHTSLGGVRWSEVKLPFDSFAITLDEPVPWSDGAVDCIVVNRVGEKGLFIHGSGPGYKPWSKMGPLQLAKLRDSFQPKKWNLFVKLMEERQEFLHVHAPMTCYFASKEEDQVIEESHHGIEEVFENAGSPFAPNENQARDVFRIVAGLCLYITSLPGSVTRVGEVQKLQMGGVDRKAITNGAEITTVANFYSLSKGEEGFVRMVEQSRSGEVPAHWRRGFWRRPNGMGHIPDAARTIWVRPTLVRADRLPENGVPGGTMTTVKKPRSDS